MYGKNVARCNVEGCLPANQSRGFERSVMDACNHDCAGFLAFAALEFSLFYVAVGCVMCEPVTIAEPACCCSSCLRRLNKSIHSHPGFQSSMVDSSPTMARQQLDGIARQRFLIAIHAPYVRHRRWEMQANWLVLQRCGSELFECSVGCRLGCSMAPKPCGVEFVVADLDLDDFVDAVVRSLLIRLAEGGRVQNVSGREKPFLEMGDVTMVQVLGPLRADAEVVEAEEEVADVDVDTVPLRA